MVKKCTKSATDIAIVDNTNALIVKLLIFCSFVYKKIPTSISGRLKAIGKTPTSSLLTSGATIATATTILKLSKKVFQPLLESLFSNLFFSLGLLYHIFKLFAQINKLVEIFKHIFGHPHHNKTYLRQIVFGGLLYVVYDVATFIHIFQFCIFAIQIAL